MSYLFPANGSRLLYPQFETYRLRSLDPEADVVSYPLPGAGATQSRVGYNQHHLSFKEVRARISWDHLAVGEGGRGVYVDTDWGVIGFSLDVGCSVGIVKTRDTDDTIDRSAADLRSSHFATHAGIFLGPASRVSLSATTEPGTLGSFQWLGIRLHPRDHSCDRSYRFWRAHRSI